jgi:hypothetical protein
VSEEGEAAAKERLGVAFVGLVEKDGAFAWYRKRADGGWERTFDRETWEPWDAGAGE